MALATSTSLCSPPLPSPRRPRLRYNASVTASATTRRSEEGIVIVGAGVAGLATAVALRRLGVGAAVLEQGEALRAGGTSLTLFKNGWRVLDAIGVADELRAKYLRIQGMRMRSPAAGGRDLREFSFDEEAPGQEVRAVERRVLLETLASKLPPDTISFSSKLKSIAEQGPDGTLLELEDGRQILSKIVIGCDGVNSPIARWMGFSEPRYVVRTPLVDRWLWPGLAPAASRGGRVVLAGDAWHPMTPNLGQGACCALEDAVVLARRLAPAAAGAGDGGAAAAAMRAYEAERWARVFPLTARAGLVGALVQWENPAVCAARDGVAIPRLVRLGPFLEHTNFECDLIEPAPRSA